MIGQKNSRRHFLSSASILLAGTSIAGPSLIIQSTKTNTESLDKKWQSFYKQINGTSYGKINEFDKINQYPKNDGHIYKNGNIIFFDYQNILAQPTFIYFKNDINNPADIFITFFKKDDDCKRLCRLNQFEMDGIYHLAKKNIADNLLEHIVGRQITTTAYINKNTVTKKINYFNNETLI